LGGSVSGYASLGSVESLNGDSKREYKAQRKEDATNEAVEEVRFSKEPAHANSSFKSSFAKELEEKNLKLSVRNKKKSLMRKKSDENQSVRDSNTMDSLCKENIMCQRMEGERAGGIGSDTFDKFSELKLENEMLKLKLKSFNYDDEKYKILKCEIEHLTWQLSKMEQSRVMYEDATNQLGSFLESVSTKLTESKPKNDPKYDNGTPRRKSRSSRKEQQETFTRRKSTSSINSSLSRKSQFKPAVEDPSLYSSTSCASSSFDSSYQSENGCVVKGDAISALEIKHKNSVPAAVTQIKNAEVDALSCLSSLASSSTQSDDISVKSKSKTKKALGRIASFMRKEKCQHTNSDASTKESENFSSGHFQESSSMSIIGFRGIWSLRNY